MFRCLMQGLRAFRLAVVLQMRAGCTQVMPVASLSGRGAAKINRWSLSFFVCVSFEGRQLFLKGFTVMDSAWWLVFANCRADARKANMD